jgi:methyl-accepting chemotaxis protein
MNSRFDNLSIAARLGLGSSLVLLMLVVLTLIGIFRVNAVEKSLTTIGDVNSVKQRYAINFRGSVHDRAIALRDVVLVEDAGLPPVLANIAKLDADYQRSAGPMNEMFTGQHVASDEERTILASIKDIEKSTLPIVARVIDLRKAGNRDAAQALMLGEARPAFVEWLGRINRFIDLEEKLNQSESAYAREVASGFQKLMLLLCGAAAMIGAMVIIFIIKTISRALGGEPGDANILARDIAAGNLAVVVPLRQNDRNSVLFTMTEMRDSIANIVREVRSGTDAIALAAAEIASGNQDLSGRTEQQSSSLERTASSIEQLTATVRQNAENARQANQLAIAASEVARKGGQVVGEVVSTMDSINTSARRIVDIISVIDGIAFQTNILALNAAVEAARAGEQGRGFAVVASEVRSLAQRSADAAKEIKNLISESVSRVEVGSALVAAAGNTMGDLVERVNNVTSIMGEIMSATSEQSAGIEEVNQAVGLMDQATQQNAALVEQASAAADSLRDQAQHLARLVSIFRLPVIQLGYLEPRMAVLA